MLNIKARQNPCIYYLHIIVIIFQYIVYTSRYVTVCLVLVNEKTNNYTTKGQAFASGVVMTIYVITAVMTQCLHQLLPVNVVIKLILYHLYITLFNECYLN